MKIQPPYLPSSDSTCQNSEGRWMLGMLGMLGMSRAWAKRRAIWSSVYPAMPRQYGWT